MDDNANQKLLELETKIDAIWKSVEKTRMYFQVTMWVTIFFLVVPLIGAVFILPMFLNSYLGSMGLSQLELLDGL